MEPGRQLALLWGGVAVAMVALAPFAPAVVSGLPACPVLEGTGLPCPGCGSGRAGELLSRFRVSEALLRFPLATLGWTGLVGGGLIAGVAGLCGRGVPRLSPRAVPWIRWLLVGSFVANWLFLIRTGA